VREGKSRSAELVCVGYCLLLACCGCISPGPGEQSVLPDGRPLRPDPISWPEERSVRQQDASGSGAGSVAGSSSGSDRHAGSLSQTASEGLNSGAAGGAEGCSPACCATGASTDHDLGCGVEPICGGLPRLLGARLAARRYRHPRFHPVPLQPVFLPRVGDVPTGDLGRVPADSRVPGPLPADGPPQIEMPAPTPGPEEVPLPGAEPGHPDRVPQAPRRLTTASRPGSWLFNLPVLRQPLR
jgi:hypothetical protein